MIDPGHYLYSGVLQEHDILRCNDSDLTYRQRHLRYALRWHKERPSWYSVFGVGKSA